MLAKWRHNIGSMNRWWCIGTSQIRNNEEYRSSKGISWSPCTHACKCKSVSAIILLPSSLNVWRRWLFKICLTIRFIKNFCEICKTICIIYISIFNNKSNDRKRINNYLNFLNKTNDQTFFKKFNGVKHFHFEMEGVYSIHANQHSTSKPVYYHGVIITPCIRNAFDNLFGIRKLVFLTRGALTLAQIILV